MPQAVPRTTRRQGVVLRALRSAVRPMTVAELATDLGSHTNTCREHVTRLIALGLVTRVADHSGRRGRPSWRYTAVPMAEDAPTRTDMALANALVEHIAGLPDASIHALDAGRRWGRSMTDGAGSAPAMERLVALLDEAGFAPVASAGLGEPIGLQACPFGLMATGEPTGACAIHRGLIEGAMDTLDATTHEVKLEPFAHPGLCLAYVGTGTRG